MENQKLDALCEAFFTEHQVRAMDVSDLSAGSRNLSLPQRPDGVEGREDHGENDVFNRLHQQDVHHGGRDDAGAGRQAVA